ncbi:hypothetical protein KEM52_006005 [Ascosphaera acerosa]|nr:hypothetical protein KEM52_006005 [Ascosphaera acerosa]
MREANFAQPSQNKAAVSITTTIYDRRALDSTSTLPLVNSLNNLAYLTTSSSRIRDILCVDGGIEQLVTILKQGRKKGPLETWKWNLAFQCVVNIGVRGSEHVRTRVVEADIVPVLITLLSNYLKTVQKVAEIDRRICSAMAESAAAPIARPLSAPDAVVGTAAPSESQSSPQAHATEQPEQQSQQPEQQQHQQPTVSAAIRDAQRHRIRQRAEELHRALAFARQQRQQLQEARQQQLQHRREQHLQQQTRHQDQVQHHDQQHRSRSSPPIPAPDYRTAAAITATIDPSARAAPATLATGPTTAPDQLAHDARFTQSRLGPAIPPSTSAAQRHRHAQSESPTATGTAGAAPSLTAPVNGDSVLLAHQAMMQNLYARIHQFHQRQLQELQTRQPPSGRTTVAEQPHWPAYSPLMPAEPRPRQPSQQMPAEASHQNGMRQQILEEARLPSSLAPPQPPFANQPGFIPEGMPGVAVPPMDLWHNGVRSEPYMPVNAALAPQRSNPAANGAAADVSMARPSQHASAPTPRPAAVSQPESPAPITPVTAPVADSDFATQQDTQPYLNGLQHHATFPQVHDSLSTSTDPMTSMPSHSDVTDDVVMTDVTDLTITAETLPATQDTLGASSAFDGHESEVSSNVADEGEHGTSLDAALAADDYGVSSASRTDRNDEPDSHMQGHGRNDDQEHFSWHQRTAPSLGSITAPSMPGTIAAAGLADELHGRTLTERESRPATGIAALQEQPQGNHVMGSMQLDIQDIQDTNTHGDAAVANTQEPQPQPHHHHHHHRNEQFVTPPALPTVGPMYLPQYVGRIPGMLFPPDLAPLLPREEEILMALQLLAYVSKYTSLRSFFQQSHFVPRLKLKDEDLAPLTARFRPRDAELPTQNSDETSANSAVAVVHGPTGSASQVLLGHVNAMAMDSSGLPERCAGTECGTCSQRGKPACVPPCPYGAQARDEHGLLDQDEEFIQPNDQNIFPIVEMFTVRHSHPHSHGSQHLSSGSCPLSAYPPPTFSTPTATADSMRYWACVVMRNLCRKDEKRGGIRQCAYYKCNVWEEYPRQFAKCRRCRRTKYCSKECQKKAWVYHRHWCRASSSSTNAETVTATASTVVDVDATQTEGQPQIRDQDRAEHT